MDSCPDDDALSAFLDHRASPSLRGQIEPHLDRCSVCRAAVAALVRDRPTVEPPTPSGPLPEPGTGATIGRYLVLRRLGAGGMGVVFLAYDPELDRKVALKLLRVDPDRPAARPQEWLVREARALARLAHPNVVPVFDAGTEGDRVFVAMEHVDGVTLRGWLRERPRGAAEIVDVFAGAGRGLAAAHAAGIVHRDFKPENVLIGKDGRARVVDFGLARAEGTETRPAVVGTPGYIAPEVREGKASGPASDQYSFCVALHEALHGRRPGEKEAAPPVPRVPAHVAAALERGLRVRSDERFPSMAALLHALAHDPRARGRRLGAAIAALGAVAGATWLVAQRPAPSCAAPDRDLAGEWNSARRAAVTEGLRGRGVPEAMVSRAVGELDRYAREWQESRAAACEATYVRRTQPESTYVAQSACFDRAKLDVRALVALLAKPDDLVAGHALTAVLQLPAPGACAAAGFAEPPPPPAEAAAAVAAVRQKLDDVDALLRAGNVSAARAPVDAAVDEARATGYRPVIAEALLLVGRTRFGSERKEPLLEAIWMAEASRHDTVAAEGWTQLIQGMHWDQDYAEIPSHLARATAALERVATDPAVRARLSSALGTAQVNMGRIADGRAMVARAVAWRASAPGKETLEDARDLQVLGNAATFLDAYAEAETLFAQGFAIYERLLGREQLETAVALLNLGRSAAYGGRFVDARARLIAARADGLRVQALLHQRMEALRGAPPGSTAVAEVKARLLVVQRLHAWALATEGQILHAEGRLEAARDALATAIEMIERAFGPNHESLTGVLLELAAVERERADVGRARQLDERAAVLIAAAPPFDQHRAQGLVDLADTLLDTGDVAAAVAALDRAAALGLEMPAHLRARLAFARARALARRGGDEKEIAALVATAAAELDRASALSAPLRQALARWRSERTPR